MGAIGAAAGLFGLTACSGTAPAAPAPSRRFEVMRTDAQWREQLTPAQYAVLRRQSTERPFSSPLNKEHRRGTFSCAGRDPRADPEPYVAPGLPGWMLDAAGQGPAIPIRNIQ